MTRLKERKKQKAGTGLLDKLNFFKNPQGGISVFLVIILVPMLALSALFVDSSRYQLGRAVAESAGDLTLNTALTNYDTVLKDIYGLFATAQDNQDLMDKLQGYYERCMISSGLDPKEAALHSQQIANQFGLITQSGDVTDILKMELVQSAFKAQEVENATLANPAIMKKSIVDFMKYRSPINTGLSFITSLKSFNTLSKQTALVDKRQKYYTEQESVMKAIKTAWDSIHSYNKNPIVSEPGYSEKVKQYLETDLARLYKENIHTPGIRDLYETQDKCYYYWRAYKEPVTAKDADGNTSRPTIWKLEYREKAAAPLTIVDNYTTLYSQYSKEKPPTSNETAKWEADFRKKCAEAKTLYNSLQTSGGWSRTVHYDVQYFMTFVTNDKDKKLNKYQNKVKEAYSVYQQLQNAAVWGYTMDNQDKTDFDSMMNMFEGTSATFREISGTAHPKTDPSAVNDLTAEYAAIVTDYELNYTAAYDDISKAVKELEKARKSIVDGDLVKAKENWKKAAGEEDVKDTSIARQDLAELNKLEMALNPDEMQKLIDRLKGIQEKLKPNADQINEYKYCDTKVTEITTYNALKTTQKGYCTAASLSSLPYVTADLNQQVDAWFKWTSGGLDIDWTTQPATHVNLEAGEPLEFYKYMQGQFYDPATGQTKEEKEDVKNVYDDAKTNTGEGAKDQTEQAKDSASATAGHDISTEQNRPSQDPDAKKTPSVADSASSNTNTNTNINTDKDNTSSNMSTNTDSAAGETSQSLDGMFGAFSKMGNLVSGLATNLRDNLYVADYGMSMFSYDTIQKERDVKKEQGPATTLKNIPIDAQHNWAYGHEVEYIIFGGDNGSNSIKAYGSIYAIRLGFNLIYAFTNSEIRETAFAIATPISAATLGVVPVPLIQAALIVGVSLCESGLDLNDLREGKSVPIFKNSGSWRCSASGMIDIIKGTALAASQEVGIYLIDKGTEFLTDLLDKTDQELSDFINGKQDQLEGAVNTSFDTLVTRHANTAIQKFTTLVNNAIEEAKVSGADKAQYVKDGLDAWLAEEGARVDTANDLGYLVKKEAVEIMKGQFVDSMIQAIEESAATLTSNVDAMGEEIRTQINAIRLAISNKIEETGGKVQAYKDQMMAEVNASVHQGADKLKETLERKLDGVFGGTGGSTGGTKVKDNTGVASLLSFRYSDYMRLFFIIGMYTNQEDMLMRIGDVVQTNMVHMNGEPDFRLTNSSVYVEVKAEIHMKPTLLALPIFADVVSDSDRGFVYKYTYHGVRGY